MDLPTHAAFGFVVGLVFFGTPEIGFLIALGAIISDLDRDWFVKGDAYPEEQRHRALFHNVFVMGLSYLFSPFLALGIFIHMLQDSFTTVKDRGCEWFYPISRLVKHGILAGTKVDLQPSEHIYFYQEDPENQEEGRPAIPWRRVYGPALNSKLLDRGFLFGSLALILGWFSFKAYSDTATLLTDLAKCPQHLALFASIAILLVTGLVFNRTSQEAADGKKQSNHLHVRDTIKNLLVVASFVVFLAWFVLYQDGIMDNINLITTNLIPILIGGLLITASSVAILKWYTRNGQDTIV